MTIINPKSQITNPKSHKTFADKIREEMSRTAGKEFRARDLMDPIATSYKQCDRAREYIRDFLRRGEIERVATGLYRYKGRQRPITLRQRLWDVARRMRRFNLDDLEQITAGNRETIKDFCRWMAGQGYTHRLKPGHYKVIKKLGPVVPSGAEGKERRA